MQNIVKGTKGGIILSYAEYKASEGRHNETIVTEN